MLRLIEFFEAREYTLLSAFLPYEILSPHAMSSSNRKTFSISPGSDWLLCATYDMPVGIHNIRGPRRYNDTDFRHGIATLDARKLVNGLKE